LGNEQDTQSVGNILLLVRRTSEQQRSFLSQCWCPDGENGSTILQQLTGIPVLAHVPQLRKLDYAIAVEAAVLLAIPDAAILADVRRSALARAEAIADSFRPAREQHQLFVREPTRDLSTVPDPVVTAVRAVLAAIVVVFVGGAGARDVRAVDAVISGVALAEAVGADSIPGAVVGAVVYVEHPKVVEDAG